MERHRRSPVRALLLTIFGLVISALAACTGATGTADNQASPSEARRMFVSGYEDVEDIYIEPVKLSDLALAGINNLSRIDPDFRTSVQGETLHLALGLRPIGEVALPRQRFGARQRQIVRSPDCWGEHQQYHPAVARHRRLSPVQGVRLAPGIV